MSRRMDKYSSSSEARLQEASRFKKNRNLYEQIYNNKTFTEFAEVDPIPHVIDFSDSSTTTSDSRRENYQKSHILYSKDITPQKKFSFDKFEQLNITENQPRITYDINDILKEAKQRRSIPEDDEKKQRLKKVEYNILSDLSKEKIREYREKKEKMLKEETSNLEELIHTITSNSLRNQIDNELFSDLLPSKEDETLVSGELSGELKEEIKKLENNYLEEKKKKALDEEDANIDKSFFTKSMDLSKEDFEYDKDDDDAFFDEASKMGWFKKLIIVLFVLTILAVIGYVIYRFI